MKRTLLCILSVLMTIIIKAGDVTPEVAMKQAADFVKERVANGSRRAPSASQLTIAKKVSGLYVFNVGNREGFVIVSPDDRTEAILGYSDSGDLNPDNMPDNMKAWLQGYADEMHGLSAITSLPAPLPPNEPIVLSKPPLPRW